MHGKFKHDVKIGEKDELIVNGNKIKCIQASREGPKALPWKDRESNRNLIEELTYSFKYLNSK